MDLAGDARAGPSIPANAVPVSMLASSPIAIFFSTVRANVTKNLQYVSLRAMHHLMEGLSFKVPRCAEVLDSTLAELNVQTGIPDKIVRWNERGGNAYGPLALPGRGRIIVDISETLNPTNGTNLLMAQVMEKKDEKETAPVVFLSMRSSTLDIPMRAELPLRALLKGCPDLSKSYAVYLHALLTDRGDEFIYYGITKRGWNRRFLEHANEGMTTEARRLFPQKFGELIDARAAQRAGRDDSRPKLAGIVSAVCAVGVDEDMALDIEEYLVDKYSLAAKHPGGLNMIPGGHEGIRVLHELSGRSPAALVASENREAALDEYLIRHPQFGIPKPGVAMAWNNPVYAEAVICGRDNRLTPEQVREIRFLAATGWGLAAIVQKVGAIDEGQIRRVLASRTYSRIR
jgi:hypothetical protein